MNKKLIQTLSLVAIVGGLTFPNFANAVELPAALLACDDALQQCQKDCFAKKGKVDQFTYNKCKNSCNATWNKCQKAAY